MCDLLTPPNTFIEINDDEDAEREILQICFINWISIFMNM